MMQTDTRNVQDKYRGWETELISNDLSTGMSGFIAAFVNVDGDFNKASGVRNMNWFNGNSTVMFGKKKWDKRGAVGTHHYKNVVNYPYEEIADHVASWKAEGIRIIAAEIDDRAINLVDYDWPENVVVFFGEENAGLSQEVLDLCDDILAIPGRGSVRSLNVSTTSGIFLYDYSVNRGYI